MSLPTPSLRRLRRQAPLGALLAAAALLGGQHTLLAAPSAGPAAVAAPSVASSAPASARTATTTAGSATAAIAATPSRATRTAASAPSARTTRTRTSTTAGSAAAPVRRPAATPVPTSAAASPAGAAVTPATPTAAQPAATLADNAPAAPSAPAGTAPRSGAPAGSAGSAGEVVGVGTPSLPTPIPVTLPAPGTDDPLAGQQLYADTSDWTQQQALKTLSGSSATTVRALAAVPQAKWIGASDQVSWIAGYISRAAAAGQLPSLVLYAIPGRDCGSFSAGGFSTSAQYLAWVAGVRQAIAGRDVVVVVEPDALAQGSCSGSAADTAARVATIAGAVDILTADPSTAVYIDAGHEWWMTPQVAAARLVAAHVQKARGFSLNVSNFYATAGEVAFGQKVVGLIQGLAPTADPHFVVDTSRNGNGPAPAGQYDWCNPTGRLLGAAPGAVSGQGALDGYLWVKHPGESDGSCHPGDPSSGQWFSTWANDIVARSVAAGLIAGA